VSGSPCLGPRCQASRRRQRAGLARLTHAAATRNPRGITPSVHRDHFFASPATRKTPSASRVS
jgi:hypothetical protein